MIDLYPKISEYIDFKALTEVPLGDDYQLNETAPAVGAPLYEDGEIRWGSGLGKTVVILTSNNSKLYETIHYVNNNPPNVPTESLPRCVILTTSDVSMFESMLQDNLVHNK